MGKRKLISRLVLISGILLILLSFRHNLLIFKIILGLYNKPIPPINILIIHGGVGAFVLFLGLLNLYAASGIKRLKQSARYIGISTGGFIGFLGFVYIFADPANIYAYVALSIGCIQFLPLVFGKFFFNLVIEAE